MKMNKTLKSTFKYLIEMVIVAFGVFLGVYYSNLNAEKKTNEEKRKSINLIISELETNKQLLEENIAYHEVIKNGMKDVISSLSEEDMNSNFTRSKFQKMEIEGWAGFDYARLQKTAYESAKTSGVIKEFDIVLIQKLSGIYYSQESYVDLGKSILDRAIGINSSMKTMDFITTIDLMTSDLLGEERQLIGKMEKTIEELKTQSVNEN